MPGFCSLQDFIAAPRAANALRLLSFNMQVGIQTSAYHHYLLHSWQHILPSRQRQLALSRIADLVAHFDIVALQEADGGSFRSSGTNQIKHIAGLAEFPYWYHQVNRNLGGIARHSNGLLSRYPAARIRQYPLPGRLPGRGLMVMQLGDEDTGLTVVVTHLALGQKTQLSQLDFLCDLVAGSRHLVIMGDLNQDADVLLQHSPLKKLSLHAPRLMPTYPSWQPKRGIDHIFLSDNIRVLRSAALDHPHSDHLPIAAEIEWPGQ
tara:strand:+ start:76582 stop:77370 length:789 start_codon:yes stop_codon:yes gene_type:complete